MFSKFHSFYFYYFLLTTITTTTTTTIIITTTTLTPSYCLPLLLFPLLSLYFPPSYSSPYQVMLLVEAVEWVI